MGLMPCAAAPIENGVKRKNRETMGATYLSYKIM